MTDLLFRLADTQSDYANCIQVRTLVFVHGQGWPLEYQIDSKESACRHILGIDDKTSCAALRWRNYEDGIAKIERVAVLEAWRGRGIGLSIMRAAITDIQSHPSPYKKIIIEAQDTVIPFYEKLGFKAFGDGFMEIGFAMHKMEKAL